MKILVVSYSRTGTTKKLGDKIAEKLKAETDFIIDKADRSGIRGWLGSGRDALFKKETQIEFSENPKDYDLVVVGTPVWVGTVAPAIRKYFLENEIGKVAFFATFGGEISNTFKEMKNICKKPVAVLGVKDKELETKKITKQIENFCKEITKKEVSELN